jgi:hypothetical protein
MPPFWIVIYVVVSVATIAIFTVRATILLFRKEPSDQYGLLVTLVCLAGLLATFYAFNAGVEYGIRQTLMPSGPHYTAPLTNHR